MFPNPSFVRYRLWTISISIENQLDAGTDRIVVAEVTSPGGTRIRISQGIEDENSLHSTEKVIASAKAHIDRAQTHSFVKGKKINPRTLRYSNISSRRDPPK